MMRVFAALLFVIGTIALIDGYAEFASGEEGIVRWLKLPISQFLIGIAVFMSARDREKSIGANDA